jgi:hypothetical protein
MKKGQNPIEYFKLTQPRRFDNIRLFKLNRAHLTKNTQGGIDSFAHSEKQDSDDELIRDLIPEAMIQQNKKIS